MRLKIAEKEEEWDDDTNDFIARVVGVSEQGRKVHVAVSKFILRKAEEIEYVNDLLTFMESTGEKDAESHDIVKVWGQIPSSVRRTVRNLCVYIRKHIRRLNEEWDEADPHVLHLRLICESEVAWRGGAQEEVDKMMDEFKEAHVRAREHYLREKEAEMVNLKKSVLEAIYAREGLADDEVSFRVGDKIEDCVQLGGWYMARVKRTRKRGLVPANHFKRVEEKKTRGEPARKKSGRQPVPIHNSPSS